MLTRRQQKHAFFSPQDKCDFHGGHEKLPVLAQIKGKELIVDGYDPPEESDLQALSDVATDIFKLYKILDNKHHIYTYTTFVLERLFTIMHRTFYGDYLQQSNFVAEVKRLARTEEVTYVPIKTLPKGGVFELKSMADASVAASSAPSVSVSPSERYSYGQ